LQCKTPEEAKLLRTMDWNTAFEGLAVHKPKYGIVVHGVSNKELAHTFENEDVMTATIKEWEEANPDLTIAKISPSIENHEQQQTASHEQHSQS
jgi:hypothetical protein